MAATRAVILARTSTQSQKEKHTIKNQLAECKKFCKRKKWEIVQIYQDDGYTGTSLIEERPDASRMLADMRNNEFDILVMTETSRLSRSDDEEEQGRIQKALRISGTKVALVFENTIEDSGTFGARLIRALKMMMDAEETKKIVKRQQAGRYRASRERRFSAGQINYGVEWVSDKNHPNRGYWSINPTEVATLKEAVRLIKTGVSTLEIARIFNDDPERYPPKYAKRWTDGNVSGKLHSDFIFNGIRSFKIDEDEYENHQIVEPFFTEDEVKEVRQLLARKKRGGPRRHIKERQANFLLHLIGKCSCGARLYIQDFTPQGRPYTYYRCKDCGLRIDSKKIDEAAWRIYTDVVTNEKALKQAIVEDFIANKSTSDLEKMRDGSISRLEGIKSEMDKLSLRNSQGRLSDEAYEAQIEKLEMEQTEIEKDLRRAVNTLSMPEQRDEAIKRVSDNIKAQLELMEQIKRLAAPLKDMPYTKEQKDKLYALIIGGVGTDLRIVESEIKDIEGVEKMLFRQKQLLFNKLKTAGGEIIVSNEGIQIVGIIKVDTSEEVLTNQVLGQATFG